MKISSKADSLSYVNQEWTWNKFIISSCKMPWKTAPWCESHSVEVMFAQLFEKVLALCLVCGRSQDAQLAGSLKILGHVILSLVSGCFKSQKIKCFRLFWIKWIWVYQFWPPKMSFILCSTCLQICSGELKALPICGCRLNLVFQQFVFGA